MNLDTAVLSEKKIRSAHFSAACLCALVVCTTFDPLKQWLSFSNTSVETSDFWIIPLISLWLLFSRRGTFFDPAEVRPAYWALPIVGLGVLIANRTYTPMVHIPTLPPLGVLIALIGCFLTCYGWRISWRARFPLLFAVFAIPIPEALLNAIVSWLQHGSAIVVQSLLWLLHVDFIREGLRFEFPDFAIEIATECSGIRSSFALVVLTFLIAEAALKNWWNRLLLVIAVIPLVLIKNGIRIVTLTMLAIKVNPSYLDGPLHHRGGFVFFGIALAIEGVLCWLLVMSETRRVTQKPERVIERAAALMTRR